MKIIRNINCDVPNANGEITIQLTPAELFAAYVEQEHKFDVENCREHLRGYEDETWYGTLSEDEKEDIIDDMAYDLRRNMDKYEMSYDYAIGESFISTMQNHKIVY